MKSAAGRMLGRTGSLRARLVLVCLASCLAASTCGCYSVRDQLEEFKIEMRNRRYARVAWLTHHRLYRDVDYERDFAKGFMAGYRAVAGGGSGCQPTLPPRKYWAPRYQDEDGHARTMCWFDGYSHGALVAKQDCAGVWSTIPISHEARENLLRQAAQHEVEPSQSQPAPLNPPPLPAPEETPTAPAESPTAEQHPWDGSARPVLRIGDDSQEVKSQNGPISVGVIDYGVKPFGFKFISCVSGDLAEISGRFGIHRIGAPRVVRRLPSEEPGKQVPVGEDVTHE